MATKVTFGKGNKDNYNPSKSGQIYFASDEKKIYLNGEVYGDGTGDSSVYSPQDTTATTMAIGGIAQGTKASDLKDKSVSEVLDMLLYPEYAPQYYSASISFSNKSNKSVTIGSEVDVYSDATSSINYVPAKTQANGKDAISGGLANDVTWSGSGYNFNQSNSVYNALGSYVYTATAAFPDGSVASISSKGNKTQKTANNETTLLATASNDLRIDATSYVIKATSASASYTITVQAPVYGTTSDITNSDTIAKYVTSKATTISGLKLVAENSESATNKQTFKVPGKLSKICALNTMSGNYEEIDKSGWDESTEEKTFGSGDNTVKLTYYVYKRNGSTLGESTYEITIVNPS